MSPLTLTNHSLTPSCVNPKSQDQARLPENSNRENVEELGVDTLKIGFVSQEALPSESPEKALEGILGALRLKAKQEPLPINPVLFGPNSFFSSHLVHQKQNSLD